MNLVVFGYGYTAAACAAELKPARLAVTVRSIEKRDVLLGSGLNAFQWHGSAFDQGLRDALGAADTLFVSVPPEETGDPVIACLGAEIARTPTLKSVIYLSTIGIYGDFDGAWIDEETPPKMSSDRARRRASAEQAWLGLGAERGLAVTILRLSGIYGRGRNALCDLANGAARRLYKPGQVFNRIHVEDIAGATAAALRPDAPTGIFNVTDDEPCPPQDVVGFAADLLGVKPPPLVPYEEAILSPMARAFYAENKRVSNRKLKQDMKYRMRYPSYREGLTALFQAGEGRAGTVSSRPRHRKG